MLHQIDHLLFGTGNLQEGISYIHELTGVKPVIGGSHPGLGTHNALMGLSNNVYLEIIAPDPEQSADRVWMDLDKLDAPRLFRWAATSRDVHAVKRLAQTTGIDIGEVKSGSRYKPDGTLLEWTLSDPNTNLGDGLIPFFIDWGKKGNPTPQLPGGCILKSFKAQHPNSPQLIKTLKSLNLDLLVSAGPQPIFKAEILTPKGLITLK